MRQQLTWSLREKNKKEIKTQKLNNVHFNDAHFLDILTRLNATQDSRAWPGVSKVRRIILELCFFNQSIWLDRYE